MDADMIQAFRAYMQPLTVDEAEMAVDAIAEVGPGGHFFGAHTSARYSDAFFTPMTSDRRNFEAWSEAGGLTAQRMASGRRHWLGPPLAVALADDVSEALAEFVARRKVEGGVEVDFSSDPAARARPDYLSSRRPAAASGRASCTRQASGPYFYRSPALAATQ